MKPPQYYNKNYAPRTFTTNFPHQSCTITMQMNFPSAHLNIAFCRTLLNITRLPNAELVQTPIEGVIDPKRDATLKTKPKAVHLVIAQWSF